MRAVVHPPDEDGARQVTLGMHRQQVRSREELSEFLRDNGLSDDVHNPNQIEWRGGGSRAWGPSSTGPSGESRWRRWVTAIALTAGLVMAASFFGFIGAKDVSEALTYAGRIAGALLLAVAFIALTAAVVVLTDYGLRRRLKFSGPVILLGVLTVLTMNIILLCVQILGREYTHWLWMWLSLTLWAAWALWELIYHQRIWKEIPHRRKFAAALSIGAIVAIGNFVYTQIYQPYASPPIVLAESEFGTPHLDPTAGTIHLPVTVRFKNTGKVAVWVVGAYYHVVGVSWDSAHQKLQSLEEWQKNVVGTGEMDLHDYTRGRTEYVISQGMIQEPDYTYLEPGDGLTEQRLIEMPAEKGFFDSVYAYGEGYVLRKDRTKLAGDPIHWRKLSWESDKRSVPAWVWRNAGTRAGSEYIEYNTPLKYSNEILNFTRRPRRLTQWWMLGTNEEPAFTTQILLAPKGDRREPTASEWLKESDRYGLIYVWSGRREISYAQLMARQPASP
ncbi:hypothetical protein ACH492_20990 [Streptomyces sp. NPDC019443]|uniref:hypothetical protein n=1 Tax=Streptomyces sp. NPDC019443 TaxID=3365061 RepID=UPI00379250BD